MGISVGADIIRPERIDGDEQHAEPVALGLEFDVRNIPRLGRFQEAEIDDDGQDAIQRGAKANNPLRMPHGPVPAFFIAERAPAVNHGVEFLP